MTSPAPPKKFARVACRAITSSAVSAFNIGPKTGPETRTTPMPPRPGGVAIAAMASFAMRRFSVLHRMRDLPLLGDRENIIDQPVEDQSGREKEEHDAESNRHDLHDLGLHRIRRLGIQIRLEDHRR